jgi:ATP phosphoribosyltransferase regulatory subunit
MRLKELYQLLEISGVAEYVSFDMGMVSKYNYYTGIIFRAYTYGVGDAVLTGGRYDDLLSYFGKDAAAVGFMIVVDDLMSALASQKITPQTEKDRIMLLFEKADYAEAFRLAEKNRAQGKKVALYARDEAKSKEDYLRFAKSNFTDEVWLLQKDQVEKIQTAAME